MDKTIHAYQVAPENQESPLYWGDWPADIFVLGSDRRLEKPGDVLTDLRRSLSELADAWEDFNGGLCAYYDTWADALADLVPPEGRAPYTREERKTEWPRVLDHVAGIYTDAEVYAAALSLITGRRWDSCTLRGCCQSDWADCVYCADVWTGNALECFEMEYFNTGTEWHVDDTSIYCYEWTDDGIRREIADAFGAAPEAVKLHKFTGYVYVPQYMEV